MRTAPDTRSSISFSSRSTPSPVIAETAAPYGVTAEQIGRASLMGGPVHALSPLVAAVYLKCALLDIELDVVEALIAREQKFDSDLWLVEIEVEDLGTYLTMTDQKD